MKRHSFLCIGIETTKKERKRKKKEYIFFFGRDFWLEDETGVGGKVRIAKLGRSVMRRGGKERQKRKVAETLIQFLIILLFTVDLRKDDEEASLWSILKGPGQGGFSSPKYQILGLFFSFNFLFFFFFFLSKKMLYVSL